MIAWRWVVVGGVSLSSSVILASCVGDDPALVPAGAACNVNLRCVDGLVCSNSICVDVDAGGSATTLDAAGSVGQGDAAGAADADAGPGTAPPGCSVPTGTLCGCLDTDKCCAKAANFCRPRGDTPDCARQSANVFECSSSRHCGANRCWVHTALMKPDASCSTALAAYSYCIAPGGEEAKERQACIGQADCDAFEPGTKCTGVQIDGTPFVIGVCD